MGKIHERIEGRLKEFVEKQPVFFVATAPLAADGHVNLSPRGIAGTFKVLDDHTFAWLDTNGSGSETIAHLRENGRITVMFCAFDGPPNIVRFHGRGRVVPLGTQEYDALRAQFVDFPAARAVIVVDVERVSDSCGYAVPLMDFREDRTLMRQWTAKKDDAALADYRRRKNGTSIDGLPGYDFDGVDDWSTLEGLGAIRARLAGRIDGWQAPTTWGVAIDGEMPHRNEPGQQHGLAAVVLAGVLGHDGSDAVLEMTPEQLREAVAGLEPAAACTTVEHPNLQAWRGILARHDVDGGIITAVFGAA